MELVSIIITAYNYARFLPEALRSCLAQTYQPVEIIVVDDGSTDNTREVVAGFPEVKYIYQPNQGVTSALNVGLSHAQGEFIQFLDADDTLSPTKIQRCVERRDLEAVGGFNEKLKNAHDWFMWVRLAGAGVSFRFIDDILVQYRMTPASMSKNSVPVAYGKLLARQELRAIPEIASAVDLDEVIAHQHVNVAIKLWRQGNRAEARQQLRRAIQLQKTHRSRRRLFVLWTYFLPASTALQAQRLLYQLKKRLAP